MNDKNFMSPEERALAEMLEAAAQQVGARPSFKTELEKKLMNAHQPKAGFGLFSVKKIASTAGWSVGLAVMALVFIWAIRTIVPQPQPAAGNTPIPTCPVTQPNGSLPPGETVESSYYLGNGQLWTVLWPDGKIYMLPENQETDGSFSMKWGWVRGTNGALTIEGHRLDAEAEPLRAEIPEGYGDTGFQVSALIFPSTGCWEVTGRVDDASLTFVTEVVFDVATPTPATLTIPISTPEGEAYDWNGTKLYLNAPLLDVPTEANVYLAQPDQPATIESAKALAIRFGINGQVYVAPGELPDTTNFMVTAGGPRIYVRSDNYFSYYKNYGGTFIGGKNLTDDQSATAIDAFLKSHGFDFEYQVERAPQIYGSYYVVPKLDGLALRHDSMMPTRLEILLDDNGQVLSVYGALLNTQPADAFGYGIRSAEEAFQQILTNAQVGMKQSAHSSGMLDEQVWLREYPDNEPLVIYGEAHVFDPAETGQSPLITINDYALTSNTNGLESAQAGFIVEASGQFISENGIRKFQVDSWKQSDTEMIWVHFISVETTVPKVLKDG